MRLPLPIIEQFNHSSHLPSLSSAYCLVRTRRLPMAVSARAYSWPQFKISRVGLHGKRLSNKHSLQAHTTCGFRRSALLLSYNSGILLPAFQLSVCSRSFLVRLWQRLQRLQAAFFFSLSLSLDVSSIRIRTYGFTKNFFNLRDFLTFGVGAG